MIVDILWFIFVISIPIILTVTVIIWQYRYQVKICYFDKEYLFWEEFRFYVGSDASKPKCELVSDLLNGGQRNNGKKD